MNSFRIAMLAAVLFMSSTASTASAQTIVDIAAGDPQFSALVDAVVAQDLVDTLNSDGPFTVFAPNNDAFNALPAYIGGIIESEPELLSDILLYHVVAGELKAADVLAERHIETVQGESLRVNTRSGDPYVDSSMIIATDVEASNGVVHVIDKVLIPNSVYHAVIADLRDQLQAILTTIRDVRQDQVAKVRGS